MGLNCQQLSRKWRCRNSFRRWRSQNLDDRDRKVKIRRGIFTIYHRTLLQHSFAKKTMLLFFGIIYAAHASNLDYVNIQIEMQDLRKKRCSNKDYWYHWCFFPPFLVLISPRLNLWGSCCEWNRFDDEGKVIWNLDSPQLLSSPHHSPWVGPTNDRQCRGMCWPNSNSPPITNLS